MVRFLVDRYADGPRRALRGTLKAAPPVEYPGRRRLSPAPAGPHRRARRHAARARRAAAAPSACCVMRSYLLAGNAGHYDGVIAALEARGLRVDPGLRHRARRAPGDRAVLHRRTAAPTVDARGLADRLLAGRRPGLQRREGRRGHAGRARRALPRGALRSSSRRWSNGAASERGLLPVEATMMVAIPELDGCDRPDGLRRRATPPARLHRLRAPARSPATCRDMHVCTERADDAGRARRQAGRAAPHASAPSARSPIVLFNFPPNAGNTGTAAYLSVFESLHNTLHGAAARGLHGRRAGHGRRAARAHHRRQCRALRRQRQRARAHRGRRPCAARALARARSRRNGARRRARQQSDGSSIFVLGERFGNVFVGIQPAFGYEGDPMRLLFEKGFAPTHAFSRLLSLAARGLRRARRAAFRHARRARIHARQAGRPVRRRAGPTG